MNSLEICYDQLNLVDNRIDKEEAERIVNDWGEGQNKSFIFQGTAEIYYPFYYGETHVTIKRIYPFPPRKLSHRWLVDAITGRPFMMPEAPLSQPITIDPKDEMLEPVLLDTAAEKSMEEKTLRFVMRFYKYIFTPYLDVKDFQLLYIKVWIVRYQEEGDTTNKFLGVNGWSGDLMELE